jgi:hypothetical protein
MNNRLFDRIKFLLLVFALLWIFACNFTVAAQSPAFGPSASPTVFRPGETGEATVTPSVTVPAQVLTHTPTYTIVHLVTPPGTTGTTRYITDFDTQPYAPQKKTIGGDEYFNNRWERPYTAETMDYLSDVDLIRVEMRVAAPWIYLTFEFAEPRAEGIGQTMYGAEFDLNKDDRGDYLIWGASPPSGEWTTDGVEVWKDTNNDVGGPNPQGANAPWDQGDGYDKNLVAGGVGDDPDLAWTRQIEGGKKVQLAFKYSVLGNASQFLWNGVADLGVRNPAWFDYNDHFTQAAAGSPLPVQTSLYPLKELWGLDNTCRDAYGFTPTGTEAGLCLYYGTIQGTIFRDYYFANPPAMTDNGVHDASEPVFAHGDVHLGQGACPSSGYKSATTGSSGQYAFPNIPIGTYCVEFFSGGIDFYYTSPNPVTVVLTPGEIEVVDFGVNWETPPI